MNINHSASDIVTRWRDPANTRGEVFVVSHRGAFIRDNLVFDAENSIPAVARACELGCDMVEIDVRFTLDGTAVVLHDASLDRTTPENGLISEKRYDDIRNLPLVHPETRTPFDTTLPTLEDVFAAAGERMMFNVECKTGIEAFPKVARIARLAGVSPRVTVKTNASDATEFKRVADVLAESPDPIDFIPVISDSRDGFGALQDAVELFDLTCVECLVDRPEGTAGFPALARLGYTPDGGPLFSIAARRLAETNNFRQFINTLYVDSCIPGTQWNGGRNCQLARIAPDSVYSFWIAHGATVIQSDEPEFALAWLRQAGFRHQAR